jgi:dTDP-L-rhamnose 4-epimerase
MSAFLITGGAGFIGRHLSGQLLEAGHRVRVLDSLIEQAHGPQAAAMPADIELVLGDVRDGELVAEALRGIDGVFHLAAEVGVGQSMYELKGYVSANDLGTAVLMQRLIGSDVRRVVVASSMSLYGEGLYLDPEGRPVEARRMPEAIRTGSWDPVGPRGEPLIPVPTPEGKTPDLSSVYALTKFDQEQMTLMLTAAYGIEGVALRLFNTYGPGQTLSNPYTGVLAIFAGRLLNGEAPLIFEDGLQQRDLVHVEDVARAFYLAMVSPGIGGEVFNIASGRQQSVRRVAELLASAMDREDLQPRLLGRSRAGDVRHCFADITKARQRLGFEPRRSLRDSMAELVSWVSGQQARDTVQHAHRELEERGLVL